MSKKYLSEYLDYLNSRVSTSRKEKEENDTFSYYKDIIFYLKAANPYIQAVYEECITEALDNNDFAKLESVFLHSSRIKMLPSGGSGYDHCDRLWALLDLLACDNLDNVYRVLPEGLPLSANGYPMYIHGTNILLCLLYNSENITTYPADKVIEKAEKFTISKKSLWERSVISCLLGILQRDVLKISDGLQQACVGFAKMDVAKYMKMQCQNVFGLIMLAKHFLSEEEFAQISYPEYKNFSGNYMSWLLEQDVLSKDLCVTYDSPLEEVGKIIKRPIAITYIHQKYLNSDNPYISAKDKKAYYIDHEKMLAEFIQ